jgi:hypothetical protein
MRGWAFYYRPLSVANREEAQRAFERALEIDPGSDEARIGIATVLVSDIALQIRFGNSRNDARNGYLLKPSNAILTSQGRTLSWGCSAGPRAASANRGSSLKLQ